MYKFVTIARPYAKAAFYFAVEKQQIDYWQNMLVFASKVIKNKKMLKLLSSSLAPKTLAELFIAACSEHLDQNANNLIRVMAENGRLHAIPDVLKEFVKLRLAKESIVEVEVTSANSLSKEQITKISTAMEKRLSRKVQLHCKVNSSIIAGAIIRWNNMVIDDSVHSRLERLIDVLQY